MSAKDVEGEKMAACEKFGRQNIFNKKIQGDV